VSLFGSFAWIATSGIGADLRLERRDLCAELGAGTVGGDVHPRPTEICGPSARVGEVLQRADISVSVAILARV